MTVWGPMVDGSDVERALLEHLKAWMPTMVPAVRREKDPAAERWSQGISPIASYTVRHAANEKWPEDQLPMLLAYCPGLYGQPKAEGDGVYSARFACTISAIASGFDMEDCKELSRLYASAARLAIAQHPALGGFAEGAEWIDSQNFQVTRGVEAERSLMSVSDVWAIDVAEVFNRDAGVREPLEDPETEPGDPPLVTSTDAEVELVDELAGNGFFEDS